MLIPRKHWSWTNIRGSHKAIYEAVDSGETSARIFFADFSKGFDLIDHSILMQELADLEVHPVLLSWITAFLTSQMQAVRIGRPL